MRSRIARPFSGILAVLALGFGTAWAQFGSPYLQNPDLNIAYVDSCAQFWLPSWDDDLGGFYTNVGRDGSVITDWGTQKNTITQSRNAYGLVRAYQLTGNDAYLDLARDALLWMIEHAWDASHGGYFNDIDEQGNPTNTSGYKTAFYQHYALLGLVAYLEATDDPVIRAAVDDQVAWIEDTLWDTRETVEGYYDRVPRNGLNPSRKSFNATVDAVTTHVLQLYLMTGDPFWEQRLLDLADQMEAYLVGSMPDQAIGFAEMFNSNWGITASDTRTIMGHVLKTAWCLGRIYRVTGVGDVLPPAETAFRDVWDLGYDHDFGGPYKDYDRVTGEMFMYGLADTTKAWWQMEQAITAGLMLNGILTGPDYLTMADGSSDFFMTHFVDRTYGEVYADRTRYGDLAWNEVKGGGGKAGYHSIETGYYQYLYGWFFLHDHEPVELFYRIDPADVARELTLRPVAIYEPHLGIESVTLDGLPYTDFSHNQLSIPAGTGGEFQVTFLHDPWTGVAESPAAPVRTYTLLSSYPNPFNGQTTLRLELGEPSRVSIEVFTIDGRRVQRLEDRHLQGGTQLVPLNLTDLASGLYLARVQTERESATARLILLR